MDLYVVIVANVEVSLAAFRQATLGLPWRRPQHRTAFFFTEQEARPTLQA
ncbi:MAG: hypothetical protein ACU0DA_05415 [Paracoccus sp. (in: a-proteobacteria)]